MSQIKGVYHATAPTVRDGQNEDIQLDANGNVKVNIIDSLSDNDFQATITSANATSATAVKAKTTAKKIYVTDLIISVDTAMNVQLQDDNGSPVVLMEQVYLPANSVFSKTFSTPLVVATNQDLDVVASASGNISVTVTGYVI
jgi:hypothetical protein